MPDSRTRRGPHPKDAEAFGPDSIPRLRTACDELCWLLSRAYPPRAALELVGNRHRLTQRHRKALLRTAAADQERSDRRSRVIPLEEVGDRALWIDGYNVLLTVEAALGGGVLLVGRDGCLRDLAAMSGHYRRVEDTEPGLRLIGRTLARGGVREVRWLLDRPVSNSGRLRSLMLAVAEAESWTWTVELVANPDRPLKEVDEPVATADSAILDRCGPWVNLARRVVESEISGSWIVEM